MKTVVVGLTGQSGAGKTTVSDTFLAEGYAVINCDLVARTVTDDGSECNRHLSGIFPECFDKAYKLDRQMLAEIVFADREKLDTLNQNIYPYIVKMIGENIKTLSEKYEYILLDAPTLFEANADKSCNYIVSVIADKEKRFTRIKARDNISDELIEKRFSSQHTSEFFRDNSDFVIENNGSIDDTISATRFIIDKIKGKNNGSDKKP